MSERSDRLEKISKKRGFLWPSAEIYGGLSGFYDYGHLGTKVKNKFEDLWRDYFLRNPNFHEIQTSNILPEEVLKASGHVDSFTDPITKCKSCDSEIRADHLLEEALQETFEGMSPEKLSEIIDKHDIKCPYCGGGLEEVGTINLMFPLEVGPYTKKEAYLRPETAQGCYINFLREFRALRKELPLGLASIGKACRNEISPRKRVYRTREFTQAELQIFLKEEWLDEHESFDEIEDYRLRLLPVENREGEGTVEVRAGDVDFLSDFYVYWMVTVQKFFLETLDLPREKFRFKQLSEEERAFYNEYHWDAQIKVDTFDGFGEVAGIHYRTDHDLKAHDEHSEESHRIHYQGEKFIPHVVEVSFGVDRSVYSILELSLRENDRAWMKLPKKLAPYQVAVFPLMRKDKLPEKAESVYQNLREDLDTFYDETGSIGKRYARQDEIGTPYCVTIDHDTLEDETVTIRDRDTTQQIRVSIEELANKLERLIQGETDFKEAGEAV